MLKKLYIKNHTLIESAEIDFHNGLTIITGETGSGKSIIIGALGLLLGERSDVQVILDGAEKCIVEAEFEGISPSVHQILISNDLDDDQRCIIRREININGKSRAFVNDTPVTVQVLKNIGEKLVDIVSQHQTQELNSSEFQLMLVDSIADSTEILNKYRSCRKEYLQLIKELEQLKEEELKLRQSEDFNRFLLNELQSIQPIADEERLLEQEIEILANAEEISTSAAQAAMAIDNNENSISDQIRQLIQNLISSSKHHNLIKENSDRLQIILNDLRDISAQLQSISEASEANPERLVNIEERYQALINLHKKHRVSDNQGLIRLMEELDNQLQLNVNLQSKITRIESEIQTQKSSLIKFSQALNKKRKSIIPKMEKDVVLALAEVAMPNCIFEIRWEENEEIFGLNGNSKVEYYFSANAGKAPQAFNKIASGGEMSRMMLCLKSLMNDSIELPTIIFDEIDTGISGDTALQVGKKIKKHSIKHQVIAITHLPQIAARADWHLKVSKETQKGKTYSKIERLKETKDVMHEIASLLSGADPSEHALNTAQELLKIK